jgi:chemotaxis response regulator CheB
VGGQIIAVTSEEAALETTRVLLVDMSQIMREIVAAVIAPQSDLDLIAEPTYDPARIAATIDQTRAEVVVLSTHKPELSRLLFLLFEAHPCPRVLVLAQDGRNAYLCEPLGELSPAGLLDAVRHPPTSR